MCIYIEISYYRYPFPSGQNPKYPLLVLQVSTTSHGTSNRSDPRVVLMRRGGQNFNENGILMGKISRNICEYL